MNLIEWTDDHIPCRGEGFDDGRVKRHFNLTEMHGEREFIRQAHLADVDGDGRPEIVCRTMNANRARCLRSDDGSTLWVSPDLVPPPEESSQVSQIGVADIDDDGRPEVILATYDGDVICIDATDGSVKWHRRLDWHINNPRLDIKKATASPGKNVALTVGTDFDVVNLHGRPRINFVRNPSLVLLNGKGETELMVPEYAEHNGNGHNTWMFDIDGDGLCEVCCSADREIIWFDQDGSVICRIPCEGEEGDRNTHPDCLLACDWDESRPGREILYLDGIDGRVVSDRHGEVLQRRLYPKEVASHLQELFLLPQPEGEVLLGANIRSPESKLLCFNGDLEVSWAAMGAGDIIPSAADWDGDGVDEIVGGTIGAGTLNPTGAPECYLYVMDADGTPIYRHRWDGFTHSSVLATGDIDGDGREEALVSVGTPNGPEGRFSLRKGSEEHLCVLGMMS